jgi:hypothetical protein
MTYHRVGQIPGKLALNPSIPSRMMIVPIEGTTRVKLQTSIEESIAAGLLLMNEVWNDDRILC